MSASTGVAGDLGIEELGELCDTLLANAEEDRRRMVVMERRLDSLVRVVRFGLGTLLEGIEDPASEVVLELAAT